MSVNEINSPKTFHVTCYEPYITQIKTGKKTVEGRVASPYYTKITPESILHLYNRTHEVWCKVVFTHTYASFSELLEKEGLENVLPDKKTIEEGVAVYRSFPTFKEKEKRYGAFAIGVTLIKKPVQSYSSSKGKRKHPINSTTTSNKKTARYLET